MTAFQEDTIRADDLTVHYYRTGKRQRPVLLLLHALTDNGLCWTSVARDLAATYDVIMPDARGHGLTGGSVENFSITTLAEDTATVIRTLKLEKPLVWGHSLGAITAAVLAATHPDLVRAVILEDPPLREPEGRPVIEGKQSQQAIQDLLALRALSPTQRLEKARKVKPNWSDAELEPWIESKTQISAEVWQKLGTSTETPWQEIIAHISCPLLLLTGDPANGALVSPQQAVIAQGLWQTGELVYIAGAGHNIHRDSPTAVMETVRSFLGRIAPETQQPAPRVTPVPLAEMNERTRELISRAKLDTHGEPLSVFGTIARHPKLFAAWLPFASRLMAGGSLERRLIEIVILRVAYNMDNDYEWGQHLEISASFGVDQAAVERIIEGPAAAGWPPLEALLLQATDELHNQRQITGTTWNELSRYINETQRIELCFLVGQYEMLAMFLKTAGVQLEPGKEGLRHYDNPA
jgi:N-formylmaleamate deformylase